MDCPLCGNELSLESNVCPHCGYKMSRQDIRERLGVARKHEEKEKRKWPLVLGVAVALSLGLTLILVVLLSGGSKEGGPEKAILDYYSCLANDDLDGMSLQFGSGYRPNLDERSEIQAELDANQYVVTGPKLKVLSNDGQEARVLIESLRVSAIPAAGGAPHNYSVNDFLKPLQETDPDIFVIVKVARQGNDWQIVNKPFGGWSGETVWLIGEPSRP